MLETKTENTTQVKGGLAALKFWWLTLFFCLLINGTGWGLVIWKIRPSDLPVYLHYNIYFGVDLIGNWYQLYLYPAGGLLVIVINYLLMFFLYRREYNKSLIYSLGLATIILQAFLLWQILLTLNANI